MDTSRFVKLMTLGRKLHQGLFGAKELPGYLQSGAATLNAIYCALDQT